MAKITSEMTAGEVVRTWPETRKIFARHGLTLHCGGIHPLAFVAQKHGFSLEDFLAELNAEIAGAARAETT
jgi:iron-sulfur cluster repair protein YtfE (RIC family)